MSRGKKKRGDSARARTFIVRADEFWLKDPLWYSESAAAKEITFSGTC